MQRPQDWNCCKCLPASPFWTMTPEPRRSRTRRYPRPMVSDDPTSDAIIHPAKARRRSTSESMASASALTLVPFNLCFGVFWRPEKWRTGRAHVILPFELQWLSKAFGGFKRWAQPIWNTGWLENFNSNKLAIITRFKLWIPELKSMPSGCFLDQGAEPPKRPTRCRLFDTSFWSAGDAKVQHEELLLKIEVCAEELREYLAKSAVWGPKELFELNWLRQQRPMHFCAGVSVLELLIPVWSGPSQGQLRFYRKHDRRFLRGGRFSHQVWPTMGHCKAEILEFGAPGSSNCNMTFGRPRSR